jgi:hypothetical protein
MVIPVGEDFPTHAMLGPLDVSERLPESMSAIVSTEINRFRPFFYQAIDGWNEKGGFPLPRREEKIIVIGIVVFEITPKGFMDRLIDHQDIIFPGLRFPDIDTVAFLQVANVLHLQAEEITRPKAVIYSNREQEKIAGLVGEDAFDRFDIGNALNRINDDLRTLSRVIRVPPFSCGLSRSSLFHSVPPF